MHNRIVCTCVASLFLGEYVTFQVSSSTKRTSTFCTFVYFLPSVGDHVHPQWSCFTKCLLTFWVSVSFHSTVGEHVRFQMCSLTKWLVALDTNLWSFFPWVSMCGYSDVLLDQLRWNVKNISLIYSARAWWWWWPVLKEYKSLRGRASFWHFSDRVWEAWKAGGW